MLSKWSQWGSMLCSTLLLSKPVLSLPSVLDHQKLDYQNLFDRNSINTPDVDQTQPFHLTASGKPNLSRWPQGLHFGVDYYPSQWPQHMWQDDAKKMSNASLSYIRLSEFDWAILEPDDGVYDWTVLDRSIEVLGSQGLKVIIGTPTATPPIWAVQNYDILGKDSGGRTRRFGSRRHYSFSSPDFRMLSQRITTAMAQRYGQNEHVIGWQLDNEFGCHSTVKTYDQHAQNRYQQWLAHKYNNNITLLNELQGRVFGSSKYQWFDQIDTPHLEVYESFPSDRLDFADFSSDMVIEFAKQQVDIIRRYSDKAITTNFIAAFMDFDHYKLSKSLGLDFVTWDNYPLGAAIILPWVSDVEKMRYARSGLPDFQSLQNALYRGISGSVYNQTSGPFGIMEQQPGPVNWAPFNPSPNPGMVQLWSMENFAHGASINTYFRFREVPFGQEQMHSALYRRDNVADIALKEQQQIVHQHFPNMSSLTCNPTTDSTQKTTTQASVPVLKDDSQAQVALVFDYYTGFVLDAEPNSGVWTVDTSSSTPPTMRYLGMVHYYYSALRRLGLNIDVVGPSTKLDGYKMVVVPSMAMIDKEFAQIFQNYNGTTVFGPRSASKVPTLSIPDRLPPSAGPVRDSLPIKVTRVESIIATLGDKVEYKGTKYGISGWSEWLECSRDGKNASMPTGSGATYSGYRNGEPASCSHQENGKTTHYLGAFGPVDFLVSYLGDIANQAGVKTLLGQTPSKAVDLGPDVRLRKFANGLYAFNYGPETVDLPKVPQGAQLLVGGQNGKLVSSTYAIWRL